MFGKEMYIAQNTISHYRDGIGRHYRLLSQVTLDCQLSDTLQSSRKLFQVWRTKCPARLQCSAGHFDPPSDIWWPAILFSLVGHFPCIESCRTKCLAMSKTSAGHQQKSAGHVRHVRHISRGLPWVTIVAMGRSSIARIFVYFGNQFTWEIQCIDGWKLATGLTTALLQREPFLKAEVT